MQFGGPLAILPTPSRPNPVSRGASALFMLGALLHVPLIFGVTGGGPEGSEISSGFPTFSGRLGILEVL